MRSLVVALLLTGCALGAAGCGKGGAAAEVSVNEPAGRVVEVTGRVEAARAGASRTLSAGTDVFRDDVIATNDGSVMIELFHNHARWHIDAQNKKRVDESVAWGLAKQAPGESVTHATSAAGRNGERTAADTSATAPSGTPIVEENRSTEKSGTSVADRKLAPGGGENRGSAAPGRERDPQVATAPAPRSDPPNQSPPPSVPPKNTRGEERPDASTKDLGPAKTEAQNGDVSPGPKKGAKEADREDARKLQQPTTKKQLTLGDLREPLRACLDAATPKVTLVITVAGGTRSIAAAGAPAQVLACFQRVLGQIPAGGDGRVTLDLAR